MLPLAATEVNHFLLAFGPIGAQHPTQLLNRLEGIYLNDMRTEKEREIEVSGDIYKFIMMLYSKKSKNQLLKEILSR